MYLTTQTAVKHQNNRYKLDGDSLQQLLKRHDTVAISISSKNIH